MAPPSRLHHMVNRLGAIGIQPFGPVLAVNRQVTEGREGAHAGSAVAGDMDRYEGSPVELAATAIFRDTKLVGFLTVDETQALLALRDEMWKAYMTLKDPFQPQQNILIRFQQENLPKYMADFTPEGPHVSIRILFEGEAISGDENHRNPRVRLRVEEVARRHMETEMGRVLAKLKEWKADPVGFGLLFRGKFRTWGDC